MSLIITVRPEAVFTVHTHPCDNKSFYVSSHSGVTVTFRSSMSGCTKGTQTHTDAHAHTPLHRVCVCLNSTYLRDQAPPPAPLEHLPHQEIMETLLCGGRGQVTER